MAPNTKAQKMLYWMGRMTIEMVARALLDLNLLFHEELPSGPKLFTPNHPTTLDPFLLPIVSPEQVHILVTESAFKAPVFGPYLERAGHVRVVTEDGHAAFDAARQLLEAGENVAIFPEGALSPTGSIARPHTGAVRLALLTGAPLIPVGIALDPSRIQALDTGIKDSHGEPEIARLILGGPYFLTLGTPMRVQGDVEDRAVVGAETQRLMRRIIRLSRMSQYRIEGQDLPKDAVETNAIGAISIPFTIPTR
ncbi:MAG: 1-acyl-sn-glycerol-3-phosphate acyltransferase [Chloroflexi bacterium]|nr:1-acyl-sn-glycerol-3-phosphate acyltransferase [Chloroflexota bacterium]